MFSTQPFEIVSIDTLYPVLRIHMQQQDAAYLLDRQRITVGTVTGSYDEFADGMVKVAAPIRHDPVTAAGNAAFFLITHNGVKGEIFGKFQFAQHLEHGVAGFQIVDAGVIGVFCPQIAPYQFCGKIDQGGTETTDPTFGDL